MQRLLVTNAIISVLNQYPSEERDGIFLTLAGLYIAERRANGDDDEELGQRVLDKSREITAMIQVGDVKLREYTSEEYIEANGERPISDAHTYHQS